MCIVQCVKSIPGVIRKFIPSGYLTGGSAVVVVDVLSQPIPAIVVSYSPMSTVELLVIFASIRGSIVTFVVIFACIPGSIVTLAVIFASIPGSIVTLAVIFASIPGSIVTLFVIFASIPVFTVTLSVILVEESVVSGSVLFSSAEPGVTETSPVPKPEINIQ